MELPQVRIGLRPCGGSLSLICSLTMPTMSVMLMEDVVQGMATREEMQQRGHVTPVVEYHIRPTGVGGVPEDDPTSGSLSMVSTRSCRSYVRVVAPKKLLLPEDIPDYVRCHGAHEIQCILWSSSRRTSSI